MISARALQLSFGAPPLVQSKGETSMYALAKMELDQKVIPLAVLREMPNGTIQKIEVY